MSEENVIAFLEWLKDHEELLEQMRTQDASEITATANANGFNFTATELVDVIRATLAEDEGKPT